MKSEVSRIVSGKQKEPKTVVTKTHNKSAAAAMSECRVESGQYLGEISALCFVHLPPPHTTSLPHLLAGTGSQVLFYDLVTGSLIKSFQVFDGIRVHGICSTCISSANESSSSKLAFKVVVFGERRVKVFILHIQSPINSQHHQQVLVDLTLFSSLPRFSHWILDACFLKDCVLTSIEGSDCIAIGCSDNSLHFWDTVGPNVHFEVKSPDRSLLYSMRMWGNRVEALHIASGTIYNEIIVWKVVSVDTSPSLEDDLEDSQRETSNFGLESKLHILQYKAVSVCRLTGHEGSIFSIAWSSNGSKLVSVSDDRSARIWNLYSETKGLDITAKVVVSHLAEPVLFGHTARVWDCCICDSLIITAGEDCTCRVWGLDGAQLKVIKEHIGRGVWRCLYDPNSSLLVTAGFDSAIKVHQLHSSISKELTGHKEVLEEFIDRNNLFTLRLPNSSEHVGLMDSKSEYVRCMHFTREDTLYVATNNGYLYHAKISDAGDVQWTELISVAEKVPIVCMNLLPERFSDPSICIEDWIAVGDGKGRLTVIRVAGDVWMPKVELSFSWSAEAERQLLGTFWCKSLGHRFIFTVDPKGGLKLWRLPDPLQSVSPDSMLSSHVALVAEYKSCFPIRILCLDASLQKEVLVCGDLRGNLVIFPLSRSLLLGTSDGSPAKILPINYFKGAHGISSVCSVSIASSDSSEVEIHSTGGDGCICYLEYESCKQKLEFRGMKQVKQVSLIQCLFPSAGPDNGLATENHAIGFASTDFIIWNLSTETKVAQIPCGGWRRPHAYHLGDIPEMRNCFAFVKNAKTFAGVIESFVLSQVIWYPADAVAQDEIIYIHKCWVADSERKIYPQNLHLQFHGREMHSLCFVLDETWFSLNEKRDLVSQYSCIATGCEDGTVRLTRYSPGLDNWSNSKLLGEHVGGSAVKSICSLKKLHIFVADSSNSCGMYRQIITLEEQENPFLLVSVGAKRVLTVWKRKIREKEEALAYEPSNGYGNDLHASSQVFSSMSFQWLSSHMPAKNCSTHAKGVYKEKPVETVKDGWNADPKVASDSFPPEIRMTKPNGSLDYDSDNDWRYLAVTAFHVKLADSRVSICFIVVSCSDASVSLRALILPYRLWFDIALLVPLSSPVLSLQHVIIPECLDSEDNIQMGSLYIVISGSTDGSIALWDLTESVETFMRQVSALREEDYADSQKRPRTGRGSQGGRWWRSLATKVSKNKPGESSVSAKTVEETQSNGEDGSSEKVNYPETAMSTDESSLEISKIWPLHVVSKVHQSGVNCLHVSDAKKDKGSESGFLYYVVSGGDDQALHCLEFCMALVPLSKYTESVNLEMHGSGNSGSVKNYVHYCGKQIYEMGFCRADKIASAHSSAIKGVWTDGRWVFSTGLDQRVRCWHLSANGKLTEHGHLTVSVPEPEALDARVLARNRYQIAVGGRGMQLVEFIAPSDIDNRELEWCSVPASGEAEKRALSLWCA